MTIDASAELLLVKVIFVVVLAVLALGGLWHLRASRGNAQAARYAAEVRLDREDRSAWRDAVNALRFDFDGRLRSLEETVRHMPTSSEFAELEGSVRVIGERYEALNDGQQIIRASLSRIENFLLRGKRP